MAEKAQSLVNTPTIAPVAGAQSGLLQRKCACGTHTSGSAECEECGKKPGGIMQRKSRDSGEVSETPPIVHEVLRSPGQPLDTFSRAFMEPRFHHDFSRVRVHSDARAAESALAVNALAYTVGQHVVFGAGQYTPYSASGQRLMAHELTHVVQQSGSQLDPGQRLTIDPSHSQETEAAENAALPQSMRRSPAGPLFLQRACLKPEECQAVEGQSAQTAAVRAKPENVNKQERRKQLCNKTPPDPACKGGNHTKRASQVEKLLFDYRPERRNLIEGIFIDKDIPDDWKAYRGDCATFVPKIEGGKHCIFVPETREKEAEQFHKGTDATIGGETRDEWRLFTLRVLMHETGHARYEEAKPGKPRPGACDFDDIRAELHEIAADMDDFGAMYNLLQRSALPGSQRDAKLKDTFKDRWIPRATDNWKKIRCVCECNDANEWVQKTAATMTSNWTAGLRARFHSELFKAIPTWPVRDVAHEKAVQSNVDQIVNLANSQNHRMAFSILNGLDMPGILETLDGVHKKIGIKALLDFLPVAQDVNKPRLEVALRAVELNTTGGAQKLSDRIDSILALDPKLPDDQKKVVRKYLDDTRQD